MMTLLVETLAITTNPTPGVAHVSHLAGAVLGAIFGTAILVNLRVSWWEPPLRYWAAGISVALAAALGVGVIVTIQYNP